LTLLLPLNSGQEQVLAQNNARANPLTLVEEDGRKVLKLAGKLEVDTAWLLQPFADANAVQVMYHPAQVRGRVTLQSPEGGKTYDASGIEALLGDALETFSLALCEVSTGRFIIVQATEAITYSPAVSPDGLKKLPDQRWATLCYPLKSGEWSDYRHRIPKNRTSSAPAFGGIASMLLFCDRVDRLRAVVTLLDEVAAQLATREIRVYETPPGVDAGSAGRALSGLVGADQEFPPPITSPLAGTRAIVVRALPEQHAMVEQTLGKLAQKAPVPDPEMVMEVRRYPLPAGSDAPAIAVSLASMFPSKGLEGPSFCTVPGTTALLARARPPLHKEIAKAIELMK